MNRVMSRLAATLVLVANATAPVPAPQFPLPNGVRANTTTERAKLPQQKPYQIGVASWYGKRFHGRTTASGEDFDMFELTAAHRHLALGTFVKVTNLRNGKWIIVRVNDRGPYVRRRIIDLSYGAAHILNFLRNGIEKVRLDVIQSKTVAVARGH